MRGMHANANLAYILGAAARYELTGESRARDAALAFWRQLHGAYSYVTGGSSYQEEWRRPWAQPKDLEARGSSSWPAHDHQESCVTHNTMLLSRRLAAWAGAPRPLAEGGEGGEGDEGGEGGEGGALPPRRSEAAQGLLAHAEWYERALHNGVLGTQRGVQPGAMVSTLVGRMHTISAHAYHRSHAHGEYTTGVHATAGRRRLQGGGQPQVVQWREPCAAPLQPEPRSPRPPDPPPI